MPVELRSFDLNLRRARPASFRARGDVRPRGVAGTGAQGSPYLRSGRALMGPYSGCADQGGASSPASAGTTRKQGQVASPITGRLTIAWSVARGVASSVTQGGCR